VDCDGVCGGTAKLDRCGICAGGRTGKIANAGLDCLGLCPDDPRRKITGRNASCDPIVDITPEAIDFSVPHDAAATLLQRTFPIKVSNNGPISVYLMDLTIRNHYELPEKSAGQTLPLVEVSQNLTVAEWGTGKVFEVPAQTTAELLVSVDMRSSLASATSFNKIPLRNKVIAFGYSYSGPQAKQFEVFVPINVSGSAGVLDLKLQVWCCCLWGLVMFRQCWSRLFAFLPYILTYVMKLISFPRIDHSPPYVSRLKWPTARRLPRWNCAQMPRAAFIAWEHRHFLIGVF